MPPFNKPRRGQGGRKGPHLIFFFFFFFFLSPPLTHTLATSPRGLQIRKPDKKRHFLPPGPQKKSWEKVAFFGLFSAFYGLLGQFQDPFSPASISPKCPFFKPHFLPKSEGGKFWGHLTLWMPPSNLHAPVSQVSTGEPMKRRKTSFKDILILRTF